MATCWSAAHRVEERIVIDWFTVIAQIVNFLILVVLLKHFLYGRVLDAMQQREGTIAKRWHEAKMHERETEKELTAAQEKNQELEDQHETMLGQVRDEVEAYRHELTANIREEMEQQQSRWAEAIREETDSFLQDLRKRASKEICEIARQALGDLAGAELEYCIVDNFVSRLQNLDSDARQSLLLSLEAGDKIAVVQTAFELPKDMRQKIADALRQQLAEDVEIRFDTSPDLMCGIALHTNSHKLSWELNDYLVALEQAMQNAIEEETSARGVKTTRVAPV